MNDLQKNKNKRCRRKENKLKREIERRKTEENHKRKQIDTLIIENGI